MRAILNGEKLTLGVCYYPEHWPESMWKEDLERMLDTGIEVVRIAEFAWSKVEPTEGEFTYAFFDRFLDAAEQAGMKVIFCTPTATPPAWLTQKYPEALNADIDGVLYRHGARRHTNYNSPVYRRLSARVVEQIARRYAGRPCVVGWQLDNEFNCEKDVFYSEQDSVAFRAFLQEKYGTLEALNASWGAVFWNQTYTSWDEVFVPRKTNKNSGNPHQALDYVRFISESARSFARMQSEILRKYLKPDDFVTTNGLFKNLDNHQMTRESLDFFTYDSYPNFAYGLDANQEEAGGLKDRAWSANLMEVRSISPVFGIMEQQSGANGWTTAMEAPSPRPGQIALWTMQSIAHGADFVSYFRWRTCTVGTEIYWHGILDYSGRENRRIREIREIRDRLRQMADIAGATYQAKVAVVCDYDNIWDAQLDAWHGRVENASRKALFAAAQRSHTPMDSVYLSDAIDLKQLAKYEVLFYPHMTIVDEARAALLSRYVREGGTLVIGCRSGYKDMNGRCVTAKLPGLLAEPTGTDIPEYSFIAPDEGRVTINWDGTELEASVFIDLLMPMGRAKVEGVYTSGSCAGAGALIGNPCGKGKAYYYGTAFNERSAQVFLDKLGVSEPWRAMVQAPERCEIAVRSGAKGRFLFVLNYDKTPATIVLHQEGQDMRGQKIAGPQVLSGYEAMIIRF